MIPRFSGGAFSPVTPNNGNPNTIFNKPAAEQAPWGAVPAFAHSPRNQWDAVPLFANHQQRSPLSITLARPREPSPTLPQNTMHTQGLGRLAQRLMSLRSSLPPIPLPGQTPAAQPTPQVPPVHQVFPPAQPYQPVFQPNDGGTLPWYADQGFDAGHGWGRGNLTDSFTTHQR